MKEALKYLKEIKSDAILVLDNEWEKNIG
jgi:hypothetical protein